jgi:hypothetical protein
MYLISSATTPLTPNIGTGLDLILLTENNFYLPIDQPVVSLDFDLSTDSVSGSISGPAGGPGVDETAAAYALDMVGTLTHQFTTPTAAPEIDPASAASMLTLLVGGLLVLRGRRLQLLAA